MVIAAVVLNNFLKTIRSVNVLVYKCFYKVLLSTWSNEIKMIIFIVSNEPSEKLLHHFIVSVDGVKILRQQIFPCSRG